MPAESVHERRFLLMSGRTKSILTARPVSREEKKRATHTDAQFVGNGDQKMLLQRGWWKTYDEQIHLQLMQGK